MADYRIPQLRHGRLSSLLDDPSVMDGYIDPEPQPQGLLDPAKDAIGPPSVLGGLLSLDPADYVGPNTLGKLAAGLKGLLAGGALPIGIGAINPLKKDARAAYKANKEIFDNAHKAQDLKFQAIPISETSDAVRIYQSPRYGSKAPSEYMVGIVNGEPAYIRKSDHWGRFTTNVKAGTPEAEAMGLLGEGDQFGRVGFKPHNWELQGGISSQHAERIAQAKAFRDAMPERVKFSPIGDKLFDEWYALTHTGKREAGYIPLSDLLK